MSKRLQTILDKITRFIALTIIGLLIISVILLAYGAVKVRWAKTRVQAYSQSVAVGTPVTELRDKAEKMHLHYKKTEGNDDNGRLLVWDGFAFARWFCEIEYQNGRAANKKVFSP
jgi:hypothetical protein